MKTATTNIPNQQESVTNPFTKLATDKKKISEAITKGKMLSTIKGVKFVAPL
jgi:hypothetical protein